MHLAKIDTRDFIPLASANYLVLNYKHSIILLQFLRQQINAWISLLTQIEDTYTIYCTLKS